MARKRFPSLAEQARSRTPEIELEAVTPGEGMLFDPSAPRHPGGRPKKVWTACLRAKVKEEFKYYFERGQSGLYWYDNTPMRILELFDGDVARTTLYITLLAATSPLESIKQNVRLAWRALKLYDEVGVDEPTFKRAFRFEAHRLNVLRALRGEPISGPKVTSFLKNLLGPTVYPDAAEAVTVDRWMVRAAHGICGTPAGWTAEDDAPSPAEYRCIEELVRRLAREAGVEPRQYQAAVWVGIKNECGSEYDIADPFEVELERLIRSGQQRFEFEDETEFAANPPVNQEQITADELDMGGGEWVAESPMALLQQGYSFA